MWFIFYDVWLELDIIFYPGSHPWLSPSSRFVSRSRSWRSFNRRCPTKETPSSSTGLPWRRRLLTCSETSWRGTAYDDSSLYIGSKCYYELHGCSFLTFGSNLWWIKSNLKVPQTNNPKLSAACHGMNHDKHWIICKWTYDLRFSPSCWKSSLRYDPLFLLVRLWLKDSLVCPCIQTDLWSSKQECSSQTKSGKMLAFSTELNRNNICNFIPFF